MPVDLGGAPHIPALRRAAKLGALVEGEGAVLEGENAPRVLSRPGLGEAVVGDDLAVFRAVPELVGDVVSALVRLGGAPVLGGNSIGFEKGTKKDPKKGPKGILEEDIYRVRQVVVHLGSVDKNLGSSPGWWAATVATCCPSRPGELPKFLSTEPMCTTTRDRPKAVSA